MNNLKGMALKGKIDANNPDIAQITILYSDAKGGKPIGWIFLKFLQCIMLSEKSLKQKWTDNCHWWQIF